MFIVCWIPISVVAILKYSYSWKSSTIEPTFFTLALFNSVFNPFVYFSHLRKSLIKTLLRFGGCVSESSVSVIADDDNFVSHNKTCSSRTNNNNNNNNKKSESNANENNELV